MLKSMWIEWRLYISIYLIHTNPIFEIVKFSLTPGPGVFFCFFQFFDIETLAFFCKNNSKIDHIYTRKGKKFQNIKYSVDIN